MMTPGNLDMEAFQMKMRAWVDELSTKQTENLNKQTDNFNTKLEQQTENFKQDTIKIRRV